MAEREVAERLLRSDLDYFAAGAEEVAFRGGKVLRMRGLEQVPAGCIVVPDRAIEDPAAFTAEAWSCASESGASLLRFYASTTI